MMRMRTKNETHLPHVNGVGGSGGAGDEKVWELRPGGMLVQKRTDEEHRVPPPTIRVRVKYGSVYHQVHISSQATFGELKKMLAGPTGLHHQDQKLFYKDKERDSKAFLDVVGVKDKSKIVLQEDPLSREKRYLEMKKNATTEKASKTISEISLEVDKLGQKVSAIESAVIAKGEKVAEKDVVNLIELLMNQLLKFDGITGDGDVKLQRKMQVKRVQKYVETLDMLKMKNASLTSNGTESKKDSSPVQPQRYSNVSSSSSPVQSQQEAASRHSFNHSLIDDTPIQRQTQFSRHSTSNSPFVITTQWETFDSNPSTSSIETSTARGGQPSFTWDLL